MYLDMFKDILLWIREMIITNGFGVAVGFGIFYFFKEVAKKLVIKRYRIYILKRRGHYEKKMLKIYKKMPYEVIDADYNRLLINIREYGKNNVGLPCLYVKCKSSDIFVTNKILSENKDIQTTYHALLKNGIGSTIITLMEDDFDLINRRVNSGIYKNKINGKNKLIEEKAEKLESRI